ncbi:hypothetical protein SDC9_118355 [bioreactor metagenome]|uniref:Methyltransferase FkbM domain-containing protein n=1 Tax=bioreactor metagenome TaxID=1076179 RepID=A0A645C0V0_9ZZZZ
MDCGAYSGDTISALCGHIGVESIEALYAFEPDSVSRAQLSTLCESKGIRNYSLFPIAVWNQPEELKFLESGTTASHIAQEGTKNIQANTLDHVLSSQKVTFLKMDIEGAELRALQGASNLIQSQRPVLAVCLYHTPEDLFLIPRYIRTLVSDYQLFVRIYSKSLFGEVVCYAIPPEYIKSK